MSLNNLLVFNVKRKLHRRDIDHEFEGDEVFQVLEMSETLAKKMVESTKLS